MKVKKINLLPYMVTLKVKIEEKINDTSEETITKIVDQETPYDVKGSMRLILFHSEQRLSALDLLENNKVAEKIMAANESILMEKGDYDRLKKAFDTFHGYSRQDVEMVDRVMHPQEVEVKEDPHPTQLPDKYPN
jgi:hypothetical protein